MCENLNTTQYDDPEYIKGLEWWHNFIEYTRRKEEELLQIMYVDEAETFFNLQYKS